MQKMVEKISASLSNLYPDYEIKSFTRLIFSKILGFSQMDIALNRRMVLEDAIVAQVDEILLRLQRFEPIQYIFGEAYFFDLKLRVGNGVLIPRPETEELVDWIIKENAMQSPIVLDIGSGSGAIPLAIKHQLPNANVFGCDISKIALDYCRQNATALGLDVSFFELDILQYTENPVGQPLDVIVSNPPYVLESEKQLMLSNVLDYEPHIALFVADNNPLQFYTQIAQLALQWLKPGGKLFFEINEQMGKATLDMLNNLSFQNVELRHDINGKARMVRAFRKV